MKRGKILGTCESRLYPAVVPKIRETVRSIEHRPEIVDLSIQINTISQKSSPKKNIFSSPENRVFVVVC
jgi:hypothetical protein